MNYTILTIISCTTWAAYGVRQSERRRQAARTISIDTSKAEILTWPYLKHGLTFFDFHVNEFLRSVDI